MSKQAQVFLGVFQALFLLIKSRDHQDMPKQILAQTLVHSFSPEIHLGLY
jgi:hypothetical protein